MIRIIIVEDNQLKVKSVRKLFSDIPEVSLCETATNTTAAKRLLLQNHFDLLILDLGLPLRDGDDSLPQNGVDFLQEIKRNAKFIKPFHIIGLSAFDDYIDQFKDQFIDDLWTLIKYDPTSHAWEKQILSKIEYLIKSKMDLQNPKGVKYNFDIAIITALRSPELDAVLSLDGNWKSFFLENDSTEYFKGVFSKDDKIISVVAASAPQMGMVATSVLANKVITNFRPKYLAMTGIAGGVRGVGNFGDILIADISFDGGSGKIKTDLNGDRVFEPDYKSIELEADLKEAFISCKSSREFLDQIKKQWPVRDNAYELNIHIGPFASGAGVVENKKVIEEIRGHARKLIGIDMETYGLFYTAKNCSKPRPISVFSIKSVSDYGDTGKDDKYQAYCSYTSASFLYHFVLNKLNIETF